MNKLMEIYFSDMKQSTFWPPASKNVDPITSYKAEARHTKSGKRASNADQVIACLKIQKWPVTGAELAYLIDINSEPDIYETRRRLSDLKAKNKVIQSGKRICRIAGTEACTWRVK